MELPVNKMLTITPGGSLQGAVPEDGPNSLPGDKSISHRSALFSALAMGESNIENFQVSGVTQPMLRALDDLGINWELEGRQLTVNGKGVHGFDSSSGKIDCGNSGTTMRLLAGALSASGTTAVLDGSVGLRKRPMRRIVEPLRMMGVNIIDTQGKAPLQILETLQPLHATHHILDVASAQVKTCLLLAALMADGVTKISEPGPSRDHSERMLMSMGAGINSVCVNVDGRNSYVTGIHPLDEIELSPLHLKLPGDFSSAAFLIVAACITPGSHVSLKGVGLNPTRTGLLEVLLDMGADISIEQLTDQGGEPRGNLEIRHGSLEGTYVSGDRVVRMIDEFPAFALAAAMAQGTTTVSEARELRFKESDRISDLCLELSNIGVTIDEMEDGFIVKGGKQINGGPVNHHGDHRLAMALALAGLVSKHPVTIDEPGIINESFPGFISMMNSIGADFN